MQNNALYTWTIFLIYNNIIHPHVATRTVHDSSGITHTDAVLQYLALGAAMSEG